MDEIIFVDGVSYSYDPNRDEYRVYDYTDQVSVIRDSKDIPQMVKDMLAWNKESLQEPKKHRKTRKELKAEIRELKEINEKLEQQLEAKELRVTSARQRELEAHLTQMGYENYELRQIIRDTESVHADGFAKELFHLRFGKDISEYDVELSPEEAAKAVGGVEYK